MTPTTWTILLTHAQAEWQVYNALLRRGVDCLLPFTLASSRRGRWAQGVVRPVYPGYLFARMDVSLDTFRRTTGVREILRIGPKPVFVPESEVRVLREQAWEMLDQSKPRLNETLALKPGDVVTIPEGAFQGLPAIVQGVDKGGLVSASIGQLQITFRLAAVRGSAKPAEKIPT